MIKVVLVFLAVAVIGGALYWVVSPFLLPMIGSAIPSLGGLITNITSQIQPIITYVQQNALQVTAITGAVGGFFTMVWSKIYKHNIQKKDLEVTAKMNEVQGQYFTLDAEKRGLENKLAQAYDKMETLETTKATVAEITGQLTAKTREVEKLTAERNLLAEALPSVEKAQKLIEEKMKVP